MLMHQLLTVGAERTPDKPAFRWIERSSVLTYSQSVRAMEKFAGALHEIGVRKGDRVSVVAHNGMDYVMAMFGCWRIGAIAALVNVKFADELDYYFADHTPVALIYTHDLEAAVKKAAATTPTLKRLVCMDGAQEGALSLPDLLAADFPAPEDPADETAIAHLSYTSGTSGKPKGACLMHEPTMRATNCIAERLRISAADVSFGPTALSSSYQLVGNLLPPLHRGATVNVMSRWTAAAGWTALEETSSTMLVANPTFLADLLDESRHRGRPPTALRFGLSGGGPVPLPLKKAWRDELGLPLVESYGQSELGGFVALGFPVAEPDSRLAPIGPAAPDKEVKILDAEGREAPVGEVGELCLRGGFMHGYWAKPEKTKEALRGGWLHTGDAGLVDANGYVTMRGRFSELIVVAGRTWFPRDIEEAFAAQPGIKGVAVVAVPDPATGNRPIAYLIAEDSAFDPLRLVDAIRPLVPYDLSTLSVRRISEFPMTPTGKIAKAQLQELARKVSG